MQKFYLCFDDKMIVGTDEDEMIKKATEVLPNAEPLYAEGKHDYMPWDIVYVFCENDKHVAYLWKSR